MVLRVIVLSMFSSNMYVSMHANMYMNTGINTNVGIVSCIYVHRHVVVYACLHVRVFV